MVLDSETPDKITETQIARKPIAILQAQTVANEQDCKTFSDEQETRSDKGLHLRSNCI